MNIGYSYRSKFGGVNCSLAQYDRYQSIMQTSSLAASILDNALSIGLNVTYDTETLGDGNCFYHAVAECLRQKHIHTQCNYDSYLLRLSVKTAI